MRNRKAYNHSVLRNHPQLLDHNNILQILPTHPANSPDLAVISGNRKTRNNPRNNSPPMFCRHLQGPQILRVRVLQGHSNSNPNNPPQLLVRRTLHQEILRVLFLLLALLGNNRIRRHRLHRANRILRGRPGPPHKQDRAGILDRRRICSNVPLRALPRATVQLPPLRLKLLAQLLPTLTKMPSSR